MNCVDFDIEKHIHLVRKWLAQRDLPIPPKDEFPSIGVVTYTEDDIACSIGFLRKLECNFAQIDGLVTNPKCSKDERFHANDATTLYLINKAKDLGIKGVCSYSSDKNTINRAIKHGFQVLDQQKVLVLPLNNK